MRLWIGLVLAAVTVLGVASCSGNEAASNGACGSGCAGEIEGNYENVAMVFFHSDN